MVLAWLKCHIFFLLFPFIAKALGPQDCLSEVVGVESQRRTFPITMAASAAEIKALLDAQTVTINNSIDAKLSAVVSEVQSIKTTVNAQGDRIATLEADVRMIMTGSLHGRGSSTGLSEADSERFVASKIIIKNFCEYGDRRKQGVNRKEAETLIENLKKVLADMLRQKLGELEPLSGGKAYSIAVGINEGNCRFLA